MGKCLSLRQDVLRGQEVQECLLKLVTSGWAEESGQWGWEGSGNGDSLECRPDWVALPTGVGRLCHWAQGPQQCCGPCRFFFGGCLALCMRKRGTSGCGWEE